MFWYARRKEGNQRRKCAKEDRRSITPGSPRLCGSLVARNQRPFQARRFDEAVRLAEDAFTSELGRLVSHLTERLTGEDDGRPKVFRNSAVENLTEFFQRFRELNVRSNEQLDELVAQCQRVIRGVEPQDLRDSQALREHVTRELSRVQNRIDDLIVDRPRRNILRRPR